jgi:L-seryl-tRNA(Ser) seleniumtransferase
MKTPNPLANLPSVDVLLRAPILEQALQTEGRAAVVAAARDVLARLRAAPDELPGTPEETGLLVVSHIERTLTHRGRPAVRPVFNLTGTVLHTNLGRAILPDVAVHAAALAAATPNSLEFDLETGRRGDRERGIVERLIRLTGAEDATIVNNNAAAVLLVLDTLAKRREVPVSRGELVEIGGAFRMPDIMARAGCKLREIGTTNRTHLRDYEQVIGARTALVMKVHTSNYVIKGFTKSVAETDLATLSHAHDVPFVVDLGSGLLIDLADHGLPPEPTVRDTLGAGADLVTFSGDKLLGGPQAGLIVGRRDLVAKLRRNPLKRALRMDKMSLAALDAVLRLYENPDDLPDQLPTLRHLKRPADQIDQQAKRLTPEVAQALAEGWSVTVEACQSEIGSGSLPGAELASFAIVLRPAGKRTGAALTRLAKRFRELPVPVIGRVHDDAYWLDLRCLDDEDGFRQQLSHLREGEGKGESGGNAR